METSKLPLPAEDLSLFTDLYELTMAQSLFDQKMFGPATFSLFIRNYPPDRGYFVFAGLEDVLNFLSSFSFSRASLNYLQSTGAFSDDFLEYLSGLRYTGAVRSIPEGRLFFTNEPPMEFTAPIIEAQLVETFIINQVNLQTLLTTKAARCVWAAEGRDVSDFASRRAQGVDAALKMARCSYIAGFQSTSNVLAAARYGIPPAGTMAHSFISSFPSESDAFRAYSRSFPDRTILLVDTYDTLQGAHRAIEVAKELERGGHHLFGVRIDSGDFDLLSRQVRDILDRAELDYVKIVVTGGLDEHMLSQLSQAGAPIDIFGVGTKAGVSADAPWTDMAYKLVSYEGRPVMKLSEGKVSLPGAKQIYRMEDGSGHFSADVIGLPGENVNDGTPLLEQVMTEGGRIGPVPSLQAVRERFRQDFSMLHGRHKRITDPPKYQVGISPQLEQLTNRVTEEILNTQ